MAGARFSQINLIVRDMQATLAFYRRLGLDLPEADVWSTRSGAHHATGAASNGVGFELDSRELAHLYNRGFAAERGRVMIGVELESRDAVDTLWTQLLEAGVQGLQPPYDAFWGARYAIVEDPDGNPVGMQSPSDADHRRAPPEL